MDDGRLTTSGRTFLIDFSLADRWNVREDKESPLYEESERESRLNLLLSELSLAMLPWYRAWAISERDHSKSSLISNLFVSLFNFLENDKYMSFWTQGCYFVSWGYFSILSFLFLSIFFYTQASGTWPFTWTDSIRVTLCCELDQRLKWNWKL